MAKMMLCSTSGPIDLNGGMPVHRIGVEIERQSAIERGLADQQHAAGIVVAGGQFAQPHQRVGVAVFAHVGENRDGDFALRPSS